jgi:hypothetical protein
VRPNVSEELNELRFSLDEAVTAIGWLRSELRTLKAVPLTWTPRALPGGSDALDALRARLRDALAELDALEDQVLPLRSAR